MIPSQPGPPFIFGLFLHLKSGAFGLRFDRRSSHMAPPQLHFQSAGGSGASLLHLPHLGEKNEAESSNPDDRAITADVADAAA